MISQSAYADLEIRILERQAQGYPVEMTLNNEQEFPRGSLNPESLPLPWVATASPQEDGSGCSGGFSVMIASKMHGPRCAGDVQSAGCACALMPLHRSCTHYRGSCCAIRAMEASRRAWQPRWLRPFRAILPANAARKSDPQKTH